jgi:predicted small lipoprotein YifL
MVASLRPMSLKTAGCGAEDMGVRYLVAALIVFSMAACGSKEPAPESKPPSLDFLCPPVMQKLERKDAQIRKLTKQISKPGRGNHVNPENLLVKLDLAKEAYLRVRTNAAALGCLPN